MYQIVPNFSKPCTQSKKHSQNLRTGLLSYSLFTVAQITTNLGKVKILIRSQNNIFFLKTKNVFLHKAMAKSYLDLHFIFYFFPWNNEDMKILSSGFFSFQTWTHLVKSLFKEWLILKKLIYVEIFKRFPISIFQCLFDPWKIKRTWTYK